MYGYIYLWINLITNGKYVGKHKYDKPEWDPNYLTSGELIQKKIKQYGIENFKREMIDICDSLEELNEAEKYWIAELETYIGWNKGGYNLTLGGDGVDSETAKSFWQRDGYRENIQNKQHERWADEQLREEQGNRFKSYWDDPIIGEILRKERKERWDDEQLRENTKKERKERSNNPEYLAKLGKASKKAWEKSPERHEQQSNLAKKLYEDGISGILPKYGKDNGRYVNVCPLLVYTNYVVLDKTIIEVSEILNTTRGVIRSRLNSLGIKINRGKRRSDKRQ